jgi:hypothetical protein
LKKSLEAKKDFQSESINMLRKQFDTMQRRLDNLLMMKLDGDRSITQDEYDKKRK